MYTWPMLKLPRGIPSIHQTQGNNKKENGAHKLMARLATSLKMILGPFRPSITFFREPSSSIRAINALLVKCFWAIAWPRRARGRSQLVQRMGNTGYID
jgi:hypothetical protein